MDARLFAHQPGPRRPADQLYDGVMALLQEFGQFGDIGRAAAGESRHAEHQLMLLGSDARSAGRSLAKAQEFAELISKVRQLPDHTGSPGSAFPAFLTCRSHCVPSFIPRHDICAHAAQQRGAPARTGAAGQSKQRRIGAARPVQTASRRPARKRKCTATAASARMTKTSQLPSGPTVPPVSHAGP